VSTVWLNSISDKRCAGVQEEGKAVALFPCSDLDVEWQQRNFSSSSKPPTSDIVLSHTVGFTVVAIVSITVRLSIC
jgi:hypothetical protein